MGQTDIKENIRKVINFEHKDLHARVDFWQGENSSAEESLYRSEIEIQFIIQGKGHCFINDTKYEFTKNSVLITHENELQTFIPDSDCFIKKIYLTFSPNLFTTRSAAKRIIANLQSFHHIILSERDGIKANMILEDIAEEYRMEKELWQESIKAHIESFLFLIFRASSNILIKSHNANPVVQEIIDYVELNYFRTPSLNDLAELVYVSPCHLSKVFKKHVGIGYKTYLINRQIIEAKRLLEDTEDKISSIAFDVGFNELSAFYRDFRHLVGVSPTQYRKLCKQMDK